MASRIESESSSKALRRQVEQPAEPHVSAHPSAPGTPPRSIPKRVVQPLAAKSERERKVRPAGRGILGQVPAWVVSMLVHVIAILVMALMVSEPVRIEKPTVITSGVSDETEEEFSELEDPQESPEQPLEVADFIAEVIVTAEIPVVPTEAAPTVADDLESAPVASLDVPDFGSDLALGSDLTAVVGGSGGTGLGLGPRRKPGPMAAMRGGGADTEGAVDRALEWLAEHQMPDGGWDFNLNNCPSCMGKCADSGGLHQHCDRTGATSLALLPFLGRGNTHREGPYKRQVEGGIRWLLNRVAEGNGRAYGPKNGSMYSQAIVGIALSECLAMSEDDDLAIPTQAVLDFIMKAQNPTTGGWQYTPGAPGDTSAMGWQLAALKSGFLAGYQINPLTVTKAGEFLDSVQSDEIGSKYGYTTPKDPSRARNAVGLLCRIYLGWDKDRPGLQAGVLQIAKDGPKEGESYYNYYATQVMHHIGGDMWLAWNAKIKGMLLQTQSANDHETGSWGPGTETAKGSPAMLAGRLYTTALATLILESYYRHQPIYGD